LFKWSKIIPFAGRRETTDETNTRNKKEEKRKFDDREEKMIFLSGKRWQYKFALHYIDSDTINCE